MLRSARNPRTVAQATVHTIRRRLRHTLRIQSNVGIAFAPSGTDAELIAVALAQGLGKDRIVNIVVGPNEVGSGTPNAAGGLYYDDLVPSGRRVKAGNPIDPSWADRIRVELVPLRHDSGDMVDEAELDEHVTSLVARASAERATVLLHIVAHSKTGMHAPSLPCVDRLQAKYDNLVVMVDAAQGRFSRKGMWQALRNNQLFMITGSKFFGGPPFSGALLVPPAYERLAQSLHGLPTPFGDFFSHFEMPRSWRAVRGNLPSEPNYGLLLRWAAALAEIEAYYRAPGDARLNVLRFFEKQVPESFGASAHAELLAAYPPVHGEERLLQSKTTVFNFCVRRDGGWMGMDELKRLHELLITDVSKHPTWGQTITDSTGFHLGQPVRIGKHRAALRIALGGELIVRVSTNPALGVTLEERLGWLQHQIVHLREKIDSLVGAHSTANALMP